MRWLALVSIASLMFHATACDDKRDASKAAPSATAPAASAPSAEPASSAPSPSGSGSGSASADASAATDGGGEAGAARPLNLPERPIPKGQTMVGAGMPVEVQQKAIAYMVAMRAPRPDDANADPAFANDLATKLRPILHGMDTGGNKARMNRVEVVANGRQIDLLMSAGCDDKTPMRAVVTRGGTPLATLASRGVFVVRCNDARIQCLQSTRDPDDVLCTTAPRHH